MIKIRTIALLIPLAMGAGVISAPGASAMYAVAQNEGGNGAADPSSTLQNIFNNPITEKIAVGIANKATMTPTVGMAVSQTIAANGGLSQTIVGVATVARTIGPVVAAVITGFFALGSNS